MTEATKAASRATKKKNREIRHAMYSTNVKSVIGKITKGCEIFGLSKGQFSIVNIIEEVLNQVGSSDVILSTWTAANYDITKVKCLSDNGLINNISLILDRSAKTKVGGDNFELLESYFPRRIHITNTHAKFVMIKNDNWNIVIRTSMNLNENKRLENFEISDCSILYNYLSDICNDITENKIYNPTKFEMLGRKEKYNKYKWILVIFVNKS